MFAWIGQTVTLNFGVSALSVYLVSLADAVPLSRCPGVSTRVTRPVLRIMCHIAQNDGTMRYGLRASKLNPSAKAWAAHCICLVGAGSRRATGHSPPGPARMLTVTGLTQLGGALVP